MKPIRLLVMAAAMLCLSGLFPLAGEPMTVRVGIFPFHPMIFTDGNGQPQGLYVDILRKIARSEGWTLEFIPGSWAEQMDHLQSGTIDLLPCVAWTTAREGVMDFSHESVFELWGQVYVRPESGIRNIADLDGLSVAVMSRDISGDNFRQTAGQLGLNLLIQEYPDHFQVLQSVSEGKASGGVVPQYFGLIHGKEYRLTASLIQFSPFSIYFSVRDGGNILILDTIDRYMSDWKQDGNSQYYRSLNFWTRGESEVFFPPWWFFVILSLVSLALLGTLLWTRMLHSQVRKRTGELEAQGRLYRGLVESAVNIIMIMDPRGVFRFVNQYCLDFFGFSREELLGHSVMETIVPSSGEGIEEIRETIEGIYSRPQGHVFNENLNICKDGRQVIVQWSNRSILDGAGNLVETLCIGTDITERKRLEGELLQARKMEALGTLAGGIAHDFNNILAAIMGFTELALSRQDLPGEVEEYLNEVLISSERARDLVSRILTFSRKAVSRKKVMSLEETVGETVKLLRSTIPSPFIFETRLESSRRVYADPTGVYQIVMNLCTNACHAMENRGGVVEVSLQDLDLSPEDPRLAEMDIPPGPWVCLSVRDFGTGIEPAAMARIFEPYYTTKPKGKGSGLGLSVVHGIVKEHGGGIRFSSRPARGTLAEVFFPVTVREIQDGPEPSEVRDGRGERILLVDDEWAITASCSESLRHRGYRVTAMNNPREALEIFRNAPGDFDLLLTDMTMPGMSGLQLGKRVMNLVPGFPVIVWSGYSEAVSREELLNLGFREVLKKPAGIVSLLAAIRKCLESPAV